jgi:hypothetical protein
MIVRAWRIEIHRKSGAVWSDGSIGQLDESTSPQLMAKGPLPIPNALLLANFVAVHRRIMNGSLAC